MSSQTRTNVQQEIREWADDVGHPVGLRVPSNNALGVAGEHSDKGDGFEIFGYSFQSKHMI
jgi:hypothetical protein